MEYINHRQVAAQYRLSIFLWGREDNTWEKYFYNLFVN